MVHPVDVGRQRVYHGSLRGIPDSDRLVVTCAVDEALSSPADTADAALMSGHSKLLTIRRPSNRENPSRVTCKGVLGCSSISIPYPRRLIARSSSQSTAVLGAELSCENCFAMTRDLVGHARYGLNLENGLRLSAESDGRFERVLDTMVAKKLEEIGRVLVHDDFGTGNVNSESIWEEFFLFLYQVNAYSNQVIPR
ncbi:hypothetical protein HG530_014363 [Fusarium avenaceum]|nr:hypothetical protein HG530_014363 [Fusarium avenaceum]